MCFTWRLSLILSTAFISSAGCIDDEPAKPAFKIVFTKEPSSDSHPRPILSDSGTTSNGTAQARGGGYEQNSLGAGGNVGLNGVSPKVQGTPYGDYLAGMVETVRSHWYTLLENRKPAYTGMVVLHFRLHSDGRVSNMTVRRNDVSDFLATLCEQAVLDFSPFQKWPIEMRAQLHSDYHDITFTFKYVPG
jgi:hypothetical protein